MEIMGVKGFFGSVLMDVRPSCKTKKASRFTHHAHATVKINDLTQTNVDKVGTLHFFSGINLIFPKERRGQFLKVIKFELSYGRS